MSDVRLTADEREALRGLAELAAQPMTCGGHQSMGSLIRCPECVVRRSAREDLARICSPVVVMELLNRLAAVEALTAGWQWLADGCCGGCDSCDGNRQATLLWAVDQLRAALGPEAPRTERTP